MVPLAHFTCHGRGGMIGAEKGTPLMTPFMLAVQALLEGDQPPEPATKPSRPRPVAKAADTHVILRSLAEQGHGRRDAGPGDARVAARRPFGGR